ARLPGLSRRRPEELFRLAEELAADRDRLPAALETLRGWLRDLLVARTAPGAVPLLHPDRAGELARQAAAWSVEELVAALDAVESGAAALRRNANRTLVAERVLLRLARP
ncbi:MAG TPA: DNA polymerase III subunit delta' C-terminal domain-containing protein, partial [Thermodesulfobacteriota bacterium]|nr:DNA polymerase III subunit delta' C-terminal domain-containing protein [Thermodesulfobacteriota bacterium]